MTGSLPSPDLFLARRAAAGNADAWDQLIERLGRRIFNIAFQFSGGREDAEDLTQEVFLRLHLNLRNYRGDVPLIGWALRLSRNLCIDHYRRARSERAWHRVTDAVLEQLPARGDLEAESQYRQRLDAVYAALGDLPEEFAETILLCDLQGWTLDEASVYLDTPLGTVKSRLFRARQRLTEAVHSRIGARCADSGFATQPSKGATPC
jgi:RNA polymerase sigma-70 factor (ECF subfamily)